MMQSVHQSQDGPACTSIRQCVCVPLVSIGPWQFYRVLNRVALTMIKIYRLWVRAQTCGPRHEASFSDEHALVELMIGVG